MSNMRKRKLAINRIDKLTGSMETLEELMHRIKQAESNEMVRYIIMSCRLHFL